MTDVTGASPPRASCQSFLSVYILHSICRTCIGACCHRVSSVDSAPLHMALICCYLPTATPRAGVCAKRAIASVRLRAGPRAIVLTLWTRVRTIRFDLGLFDSARKRAQCGVA